MYSPWGHKESDTTKQLKKKSFYIVHLNSVLESNKKFKPQIRKKNHLGSGNISANVLRHELTVDILETTGNSIL